MNPPALPSQPGSALLSGDQTLTDAVNAALDSGDADLALQLCAERKMQVPEDVEAHRHLGVLHAARGERIAAIKAARRACELAPDDPECWCALGQTHVLLNELDSAVQCFAEVVEIDAASAQGWHNLGTVLKQLGNREAALAALKNALLIDSTRADTYLNLGSLLAELGRFEDAVECLERAHQHDPRLPVARSRLAWQMLEHGKVGRAEDLFRQSLTMDPDHVEGWFGLGRTLEDAGQAEGAQAAYLNALRRRPDHAMALGQYLALLRDDKSLRANADGVAAPWLEHAERALRDAVVKDDAKALIGYGIAKYHDRSGSYRAAAEAGRLANAARRRIAGPMDRAALRARVDGLIDTYTAELFQTRRNFGLGTNQPVFIIGLPRSGTTLTEQILGAHPLACGAGELPTLGRLAASIAGSERSLWQAASLLDESGSKQMGGEYLRALRDGRPKRLLRISDKSPLNFFQLGLAAVMFPAARVIHCRRSAPDNALSIWMENFGVDQCYATDFDDLAFFRSEYERLMAHWRQVLPLQMLELKYEDLVADVDGQVRRLIEFLGLHWDDRCLQFHHHARAVQTPSRWQVRQPVYSRSVGRWRAYAEHLPELARAFNDARDE